MKVFHVYGNYICNTVGPSVFLRARLRNRHIYERYNISLDALTLPTNRRSIDGNLIERKESSSFLKIIRGSVKNFIQRKSTSNLIFSLFVLYVKNISLARKNIKIHRDEILKNKSATFVVHDIFTAYFLVRLKSLQGSQNMIFWMHNDSDLWSMFYEKYPPLRRLDTLLNRISDLVFHNSSAIVFLSDNAEQKFSHINRGLPIKKKEVIYNGVESDDKLACSAIASDDIHNPDSLRLVTLGTVCLRKGHDILVSAMGEISKKFSKQLLTVVVIGDGPFLSEMKRIALRNGSFDYFDFRGRVKNPVPLLKDFDGMILASRNEGMPISLIEGIASGLVVLASNVGGNSSIVTNGSNGFLFEPTVDSCCNAIEKLLSMPTESLNLFKAQSRSKFLEEFRLEQVILKEIGLVSSVSHSAM